MAIPTARGADSLVGFLIDRPSKTFNTGHPAFDPVACAAPDPPTAALGAAGLITGTRQYRVSSVLEGGMETEPSAWSAGLVCTSDKATVTLTPNADTRVVEQRIYASDDAGVTEFWVGSVYDNVTTTFTDDLPVGSPDIDWSKKSRATNDTTNLSLGMPLYKIDSFDFGVMIGAYESNELAGGSFRGRQAPGNVDVSGTMKRALDCAGLIPLLASAIGEPDVDDVAGEPVRIYTFTPTYSKDKVRTLTSFIYEGSSAVPPELDFGVLMTDLEVSIERGKIAEITPTLRGITASLSGVGVPPALSNWTGVACLYNFRGDASAYTDPLDVKITKAPTAATGYGYIEIKVKHHVSSTYDGPTITVRYDLADGQQIKAPISYTDRVELYDENSRRLGFDVGESRLPLEILFTGDLRDLQADEVIPIPLTPAIPTSRRFLVTPRFNAGHVYMTKDGSTFEVLTANLKFSFPRAEAVSLGPNARTVLDFEHSGYWSLAASFTRRRNSREYDKILLGDTRFALRLLLEGELIPIIPGTVSTHRESLDFTLPQVAVKTLKKGVGGPGWVTDSIEAVVEAPDNGAEPLTLIAKTRIKHIIPAA